MSLYNQYYSSADCYVYLESNNGRIFLDRINGVMVQEELTSYPIYGIGANTFGFVTQGNYLATGFIDINFSHSTYLTYTIQQLMENKDLAAALNSQTGNIDNVTEEDLSKMSIEDMLNLKLVRDYGSKYAETDGILSLPSGWDIIIDIDNSNQMKVDGFASTIKISNCKITKSSVGTSVNDDSQIVRRYSFIAKEISEQSR